MTAPVLNGDLVGEPGKKYERMGLVGLVDGLVATLMRGGEPFTLAAGVAVGSDSTDDSDAERARPWIGMGSVLLRTVLGEDIEDSKRLVVVWGEGKRLIQRGWP